MDVPVGVAVGAGCSDPDGATEGSGDSDGSIEGAGVRSGSPWLAAASGVGWTDGTDPSGPVALPQAANRLAAMTRATSGTGRFMRRAPRLNGLEPHDRARRSPPHRGPVTIPSQAGRFRS